MELLSNLHPLVVHFPIAFLLLYIVFETSNIYFLNLTLKKISILILLFGVAGGIISVLTGNQSFQLLQYNDVLTQFHYSLIEHHEYYASITVWYFFAILVFQTFSFLKNKNEVKKQYLFIIFAAVGLFLIYQTAKIGGRLVYEFGIGTDLLN